MSDETERENLAKAEQWLARIVDGFRPPMETSMDKAATIQTEYDRRGREVDGLKYRLECEASFTAAHQASALKWAALVAEQKDDMESLRTERDAFRGSAEHWAAEFRAVKASVAPLSEALERAEAEVARLRSAGDGAADVGYVIGYRRKLPGMDWDGDWYQTRERADQELSRCQNEGYVFAVFEVRKAVDR